MEPPIIEDFLKESLWSIHEAAFVLTKWPEQIVVSKNFYYNQNGIKELETDNYRSSFYFPAQEIENKEVMEKVLKGKIDPKSFGKAFENIYNDLRGAIENGDLLCKTQGDEGIIYLVSPCEVIIWALLKKGIPLPDNLQNAIGIRQDKSFFKLPTKPQILKVKRKIVAQFLKDKKSYKTRKQLYQDVLKTLREEKNDLTAVGKAVNELFDNRGKNGRKTEKDRGTDSYTRKPIKEVLKIDSNGNISYNFPLFKEAMQIIIYLKIDEIGNERVQNMNMDIFFKEFIEDRVVSLYLQEVENEYLLRIVMNCVDEAWCNLIIRGVFSDVVSIFKHKVFIEMKDGNLCTPIKICIEKT